MCIYSGMFAIRKSLQYILIFLIDHSSLNIVSDLEISLNPINLKFCIKLNVSLRITNITVKTS